MSEFLFFFLYFFQISTPIFSHSTEVHGVITFQCKTSPTCKYDWLFAFSSQSFAKKRYRDFCWHFQMFLRETIFVDLSFTLRRKGVQSAGIFFSLTDKENFLSASSGKLLINNWILFDGTVEKIKYNDDRTVCTVLTFVDSFYLLWLGKHWQLIWLYSR